MSEVGHNSTGDRKLLSIVTRIEHIEENRKALGDDIKEIMAEAKSGGYNIKVLRRLLRERKMDAADLEEQETLLDTYRRALGQFANTELGAAAMERVAAH